MIGRIEGARSAASHGFEPWDAARFFDLLRSLGRLRVISQTGPSTFEALCAVDSFEIARGFVNAITPSYHWHLAAKRFRHLRSHDEIHARSGRRVLYFALREEPDSHPFLRIYVHREPGAEFEPEREALFAAAHEDLADGVDLVRGDA
jgi:hypothetical protein